MCGKMGLRCHVQRKKDLRRCVRGRRICRDEEKNVWEEAWRR